MDNGIMYVWWISIYESIGILGFRNLGKYKGFRNLGKYKGFRVAHPPTAPGHLRRASYFPSANSLK